MSLTDRVVMYGCVRDDCNVVREQPPGVPAPDCYDYNPGSKQRFPDGSWVMLGESFTPHGTMVALREVDANPLKGYRDDARRASRLEAGRLSREAEYERALDPSAAPEPAGVSRAGHTIKCRLCKHPTMIRPGLKKKGEYVCCENPSCAAPIMFTGEVQS